MKQTDLDSHSSLPGSSAVAALRSATRTTVAGRAPRSTSSRRKDGETVTSPVTVRFGLKGMGIAPAGIAFDNTGHHHLIIDADLPPHGRARFRPTRSTCTSARARPRRRSN